MNTIKTTLCLLLLSIATFSSFAHGGEDHPDVEIHTFSNGETYTNCSFIIHPSLTQNQLNRFAKEAGNIVYFNPLNGASTLGQWNVDIAFSLTRTPIDQTSGAWNNTFAHPIHEANETPHFLGDQIHIPNLRFGLGITEKIDAEMYITKDFNANYGLAGMALKYGTEIRPDKGWYAAGRVSHSLIYGPEEISTHNTGLDLLLSKKWKYVEPYLGANLGLNSAITNTDKVDLKAEHILTPKAMMGVRAKYKIITAAVEYDFGVVNTLSFSMGVRF